MHIEPISGGKGVVICAISDDFYQNLEPATLDVNIKSQLTLIPDGAYLLKVEFFVDQSKAGSSAT